VPHSLDGGSICETRVAYNTRKQVRMLAFAEECGSKEIREAAVPPYPLHPTPRVYTLHLGWVSGFEFRA